MFVKMKRNFFKYLFCTLAAILTLASFTGCKDDEDDTSNALEGTVWMRKTSGNTSFRNVRSYYEIMYFTKNKVGVYPLDKDKKTQVFSKKEVQNSQRGL